MMGDAPNKDGGKFAFDDAANRTLVAHKIVVNGEFTVGRDKASRFTHEARIELDNVHPTRCADVYIVDSTGTISPQVTDWQNPGPLEDGLHPVDELNRTLAVRDGGRLNLHGNRRDTTWALLGAVANQGDHIIELLGGVSSDWSAGDALVIASTDYDMDQAEVHTIYGISSPFIAFDGPGAPADPSTWLTDMHWSGLVGTDQTAFGYPNVYENAEVGLLSHNIKVYAPDPDYLVPLPGDYPAHCTTSAVTDDGLSLAFEGAEIRITKDTVAPLVKIQHIEVFNAGKFGNMGHYPIHFHMLEAAPGSYVQGSSIYNSANKAVVVHATQQVRIEDNVAYNVLGHQFYLEPDSMFNTAENIFHHNLGVVARACNPLDIEDDSWLAANFYFEDARNVLAFNAGAGAAHSGFYFAAVGRNRDADGSLFDDWHLCGDGLIDYSPPGYNAIDLNESAFSYAAVPYTSNEYDVMGFDDGASTVPCHGSFIGNTAHSASFGFWADEHKDTMIRLYDFTSYKIGNGAGVYDRAGQGVAIKNKGATELVGLRAADSKTAVWPASHAYHMWKNPRWLVIDSHIVGESNNIGSSHIGDEVSAGRSLPDDSYAHSIYGVEVYEGHLHVSQTSFELFAPLCPAADSDRPIAAFGRHRTFPFYSNNPNNSIQSVIFDAASRRLYFDDPDLSDDRASGHATVVLYDVDSDNWIVPDGDFILPGVASLSALDPSTCWNATYENAHVVPGTAEQYLQLIVSWCDTTDDGTGNTPACHSFHEPSKYWEYNQGAGVYGIVKGLEIRDTTEAPPDILRAKHSVQGTHNRLGGNLLASHAYDVSFWRNNSGSVLLDPATDFATMEAIEVHLRNGQANSAFNVSVPADKAPDQIRLYRNDDPVTILAEYPAGMGGISVRTEDGVSGDCAVLPTTAADVCFNPDHNRVYMHLDAGPADYENATMLLLFNRP